MRGAMGMLEAYLRALGPGRRSKAALRVAEMREKLLEERTPDAIEYVAFVESGGACVEPMPDGILW